MKDDVIDNVAGQIFGQTGAQGPPPPSPSIRGVRPLEPCPVCGTPFGGLAGQARCLACVYEEAGRPEVAQRLRDELAGRS